MSQISKVINHISQILESRIQVIKTASLVCRSNLFTVFDIQQQHRLNPLVWVRTNERSYDTFGRSVVSTGACASSSQSNEIIFYSLLGVLNFETHGYGIRLDGALNFCKASRSRRFIARIGGTGEIINCRQDFGRLGIIQDAGVEAEMEKHAQGKNAFLVKQDFFQRVDQRSFVQEKAQRDQEQRSKRGK
jgi:hypothetical protein